MGLHSIATNQNWECWLCGDKMYLHNVSADHVIPQVLGGRKGEIRAAHQICNSFRGSDLDIKPKEYYREHRIRIENRIEKRRRKKPRPRLPIAINNQIPNIFKPDNFFELTERLFRR